MPGASEEAHEPPKDGQDRPSRRRAVADRASSRQASALRL